MKKYKKISIIKNDTDEIYCNMCAKKIEKDKTGIFYDHLEIKKTWGYFSSMDGEAHEFELCEDCYREIISKFKIPITDFEERDNV